MTITILEFAQTTKIKTRNKSKWFKQFRKDKRKHVCIVLFTFLSSCCGSCTSSFFCVHCSVFLFFALDSSLLRACLFCLPLLLLINTRSPLLVYLPPHKCGPGCGLVTRFLFVFQSFPSTLFLCLGSVALAVITSLCLSIRPFCLLSSPSLVMSF